MSLRWCGLTSDSHLIEPHVTQDWWHLIAVSAVAVGSEVVCLKQCFLGFWWLASVSSYHVCGCKSDCVKSKVSPFFFPSTKAEVSRKACFFFLFEVVSVSQCLVDHFFLCCQGCLSLLIWKLSQCVPHPIHVTTREAQLVHCKGEVRSLIRQCVFKPAKVIRRMCRYQTHRV